MKFAELVNAAEKSLKESAMKKMMFVFLTCFCVALAGQAAAMQKMDHGSMGHSGHKGEMIHMSTVKGYKLAYHLIDMKEKMKAMKNMPKMDMSKMKSHHLMVYVTTGDGKMVKADKAGYSVKGPDGKKANAMAMFMTGGHGADVDLVLEGKYKIRTKLVVGDKTLKDSFGYEVK